MELKDINVRKTSENELVLNDQILGKFEIVKNANDCANILEFHSKGNYVTLYDGNTTFPKRNVDITNINITFINTLDFGNHMLYYIELDNITHSSGNIRSTIGDIRIIIKSCLDSVLFNIAGSHETISFIFNNNTINMDDVIISYNDSKNKQVQLFNIMYEDMMKANYMPTGGNNMTTQQPIANPYPQFAPINPAINLMVKDVEDQIFALEGVRIIFRVNSTAIIKSYNYNTRYDNGKSVIDWIKERIYPIYVDCMAYAVDYDIIANNHIITDKTITMKQLRKLTNKPVINNDITEKSIMKNAIVDDRNIEEPVINWE